MEELPVHYHKQVRKSPPILLDADRDDKTIWRRALIFYKSNTCEELKRPVSVCFDVSNEIGIDAGGPMQEYFANLLRVVNEEVFEGEEGHRVPQRTWDKCHLLKMTGIMISHSILHKGPHFSVLAPHVYQYIHSGNKELSAGYITAEDFPRTPALSNLVSLVYAVS